MGVRVEDMRVGGVMAAVAGMETTGGTMRLARVMAGVFLLLVLVATGAEGSAFCWSCSSSEKLIMQGILGAGAEGRAVLQMGSLISAMTRLSCS